MFNQEYCPVVDQSWIPAPTWRDFDFLEQKKLTMERADLLDEVPAMSSTVLGLDMLRNEPFIDLGMASDLILGDVGATIQILRLISREYGICGERPSRMGDCIASLDVSAWFGAISAHTFVADRKHLATAALWKHCRQVARYAQLVAESLDGISPEDAYLAGLLHGIEQIPEALGWRHTSRSGQHQDILFAMGGAFPPFVLTAIRSLKDSSAPSVWKSILYAAHELAGARVDFDGTAFCGKPSLSIGSRD